MTTQPRTLAALGRLSVAFPHWTADEDTLRLYASELDGLEPEYVERAVADWIRSERGFAPTSGQLRTKARELRWESRNQAATEALAIEGPREREVAAAESRRSSGTLTEMLVEASDHWRYWLDKSRTGRDYAPNKRVPSVQWAFPPRGADCPCSECRQEFRVPTGTL